MEYLTGVFSPNWWQTLLIILGLTHVTIITVTIYLHRHAAHRALELHPALKIFFRIWLWMTTSMHPREWSAVHRKHHAFCETEADPHSPQVLGLHKVLTQGAELYAAESKNPETLRKFGQGFEEDWLERHVIGPHENLGVTLMGLIDLLLFGPIGITIWAVQMLWMPVCAAGVINGLGHFWGYRNYECPDAARNIVPWGVLIGGEELHNNHHTYPNSARMAYRPWEFDLGWFYIRILRRLGMVRVISQGPIAHCVEGKDKLDQDTLLAVVNNRFQIMALYRRHVLAPALHEELKRADESARRLIRRAKGLLSREDRLIDFQGRERLQSILDQSPRLRLVYEKRLALQGVWQQAHANQTERLKALTEWCRQAEASGIESLHDFARQLRSYSLQPASAYS